MRSRELVLLTPTLYFRYYLIMVAMFFTVSVVNNYALNLNIAMPLHMIFRSVSVAVLSCPISRDATSLQALSLMDTFFHPLFPRRTAKPCAKLNSNSIVGRALLL